jgi:Domain of unknown function (DUF4403)
MRFLIVLALLVVSGLFFWSCGGGKNAQASKPLESYAAEPVAPPAPSFINIPFSLDIKEIENAINTKLSGVLFEDNNIKDDDLMMKATKTKPIVFGFDGQAFTYKVPIKIWIKRALPIGSVEADGELSMAFTTRFNINPDWTGKTVTSLSSTEWIKTPVLKAGFVEIPIKPIVDLLISRMQSKITAPLDQQLSQALDMRITMRDAWSGLQAPMKINEDYKMWVKMTPQELTMAPLKNVSGKLQGQIRVQTLTDVIFGDAPAFRPNSTLPAFKWVRDAVPNEPFTINILTDMPYPEAARMARQFLKGYTYTSGKRAVTVNDIQLYGQGERMVIETALSGSYNGKIYLVGKPVFDAATNSVRMTDVQFDLGTKNMLLKSAKWLVSGPLERKIAEGMVFPLAENLTTLKQTLNDQLRNYQATPSVAVRGDIKEIAVEDVSLQSSGIIVRIKSVGNLNADIKGLGF